MNNEQKNVIYRIQFKTDEKFYDLFVRHVYPADMAGFICIESFVFREQEQLIIDPLNERLANEFANVETAFIPYYQIIRIDQVTKVGESQIKEARSSEAKIRSFPTT